jgi:hypothetical protein
VNPDMQGGAMQAKLTPASAKAAAAAGVKPAALVTRLTSRDRALPKPAFEIAESKLSPKAVSTEGKKPVAKTQIKLRAVKTRRSARKAAPKKAAWRGKPAKSAVAKKNGSTPSTTGTMLKPSAGKRAPPAGLTAQVPAANQVPKPSPAVAKQQGTQSSN